jgi:hypothetical protein
MQIDALIETLSARGVKLTPDGDALVARPASRLTDADRDAIRAHKPELRRLLLLDRIEATWKPGEWLAYREGGQLVTARYSGTSTAGTVNVWLADGGLRVITAETVALDWTPDAAETFEERLCIMLEAGVPEEVARERAEQCTRDYLNRLAGGRA